MNINQAKEEVKNAVRVYLQKDEAGQYEIPVERQRPILLMGPPGIGKTAIMEQIAHELSVNLVAYTITHHTRQSAIGLPMISEKEFGGKMYSVTEYTMSEIIGAVYEQIEKSGVQEGILFLDEINCVSETLAPTMLQFLQYKTFGNHPIPEGWVIVCAGNPPEYNKSVREFDVVTLDRVKKINIEPDYPVWREYALERALHPAVITYLDARKKHFYSIENTNEGKSFVTARGWEDLSRMLLIYEDLEIEVTERLIRQYVQNDKIAKDFSIYLALFRKYRSDYHIADILEGRYDQSIRSRAAASRFDERLSLLGLLLDALVTELRAALAEEDVIGQLQVILRDVKAESAGERSLIDILSGKITASQTELETLRCRGRSRRREDLQQEVIVRLEEFRRLLAGKGLTDNKKSFAALKKAYEASVGSMEAKIDHVRAMIDHLFMFVEDAYGKEKEMLVVLSELTARPDTARFLASYGSDRYFENNEAMLFYQREVDILGQLDELKDEV
jgi:hypothetical protein